VETTALGVVSSGRQLRRRWTRIATLQGVWRFLGFSSFPNSRVLTRLHQAARTPRRVAPSFIIRQRWHSEKPKELLDIGSRVSREDAGDCERGAIIEFQQPPQLHRDWSQFCDDDWSTKSTSPPWSGTSRASKRGSARSPQTSTTSVKGSQTYAGKSLNCFSSPACAAEL